MPIAVSSDRRATRWPRWVGACLLGLFVVLVGGALWAYAIARSALPQLDGSLLAPGLQQKVVVTRDAHGVPTIDAANLPDLFVAQGYVTAQDRLWQMDIMRRFASGRLAEVVGRDGLEHDKQQRILGIPQVAQHSAAALSARDREYFEAYTRGVNAGLEHSRSHLPLEFRILHYSPEPWTVEDCFAVGAELAQELNHGRYRYALLREQFQAALGPTLTADLFVNGSRHDHPPVLETVKFPDAVSRPSDEEDDEDMDADPEPVAETSAPSSITVPLPSANRWDGDYELAPGSNNWAVSGAHTVSGKPLLSNDMHLGHQMPNLWYEAHLHSGALDVAGVTLPGMPYVVVGHNQRIAWGFTNVGPTVTDVFIENFNAQGAYQTPAGWAQPEHRAEVIHVKGQPDVTLDVRLTRHGPIITDLVPGETRPLALRWTLYDGLRIPFFDVNSAQNWDEFCRAFSQLDAPGQNVVYADVDGNIGYHTTGKVPIRAAGDGSLPVNGADNAHDWTSYIPFEKLPHIYNPPSGIIATANGRITPDGYPNSLSMEWEAPWRTARIYHVLESGRQFSAADMLSLQTDVHSEAEQFAAERFVYAVDHTSKPSARSKQAAELMRGWDGRMLASSAAPTIAQMSIRELRRLLLEPKLGTAPSSAKEDSVLNWRTYSWEMRSIWLENILLHRPKRWLPDKYSNYDELLTAAVDAAVNDANAPKDLASWRWGAFNAVEIQHPILKNIPVIRRWSGPGVQEQSGSGYTVKAVSRSHGPSERFTANLADLDQSTLNIVTGQGGNFLSPYYMDQWKAWYTGTTFPLPFTSAAVAANKSHVLTLEPMK